MSALSQADILPFPSVRQERVFAVADDVQAILTIDLAAIAANWQKLSRIVGSDCSVAAVVKADAYGLGIEPVVRALTGIGCRWFFVASLQEGREVIRALGGLSDPFRVAVLHGLPPGSYNQSGDLALVPVLNDEAAVATWCGCNPGRAAILHLDTGMSRLGLDVASVVQIAGSVDGLNPILVMSHLACADQPDHPLNEAQRVAFETAADCLPKAPRSLAASAGVFLGEAYHHQMVRVGLALWGVNPTAGHANPMQRVIGLQARLLQIRDIEAGQTVGYGASFAAKKPMRLATVAIGYADGILRSAGNRASAMIGGFAAPFVGRVSMDLITLDVSDLPRNLVQPGMFVDLIGDHYSINDLARDSGTIGYEVLTRLSRRLHRVYLP